MSRRRRGPTVVLIACVAWTVAASEPDADQALDLTVTVVDSDNRAVNGLTAADLGVEIDGAPAPIVSVAAKTLPLAVVLVVDRSPSMGLVVTPEGYDADFRTTMLNGFLPALSPPDTGALGVFGRTAIVVSKPIPLTKAAFESALRDVDALEAPDIARRLKALREPEFLPPVDSPIWDAGDHALRALATDARHRVVVMVTDGRATGSLIDPETLAERAVRARTAISFVHQGGAELVAQDAAGRAAVRSDLTVRWIAEATGGIYLADASARGLHPRFNVPAALVMQAIRAHRQSYVLGVAVAASNRTRTLKVTTRDRALRVLAPASIPGGSP